MFRARQERKSTVFPGVVDCGGMARRGDQGGHQDVSIEHHAHQALSAFALARRSTRTSRTASSMNFERSPFFMPWAPRKVRRVRSVSFETLMFQRTASSSIRHLNTQADKHLYAYRRPESGGEASYCSRKRSAISRCNRGL